MAAVRSSGRGIAILLAASVTARLQSGNVETYLSPRIADYGVLAADVFIALALLQVLTTRSGRVPVASASKWLLALALVFALGAMNPLVWGTQASLYGTRAIFISALTLYAASAIAFDRRSLDQLFIVVVANLSLNAMVALRQALFGVSDRELARLAANGSTFVVDGSFRVPGIMASGQELAFLVAGTGAAAAVAAATMARGRARTWCWLLAVLSLATAVVALQRGPLLGAVAGVAIGLLAATRTSAWSMGRAVRVVLVGVVVVVLGWGAFQAVAPVRAADFASSMGRVGDLGSDDSFRTRQAETIPIALKLANDRWLGYGTGATGSAAQANPMESPLRAYPLGGIVADNGYLFVWLQVGFVGLFLLLAFLWSTRRGLRRGQPTTSALGTTVGTYLGVTLLFGSYLGLATAVSTLLLSWAVLDQITSRQAQKETDPESMRSVDSG